MPSTVASIFAPASPLAPQPAPMSSRTEAAARSCFQSFTIPVAYVNNDSSLPQSFRPRKPGTKKTARRRPSLGLEVLVVGGRRLGRHGAAFHVDVSDPHKLALRRHGRGTHPEGI